MELFRAVALMAATMTTGLMAGLYYAFVFAVMRGLARADDATFVTAMQRVNTAILNGWFFLAFMGSLVLSALAALLHLGEPALPWAVAGFVLYAVGFATTMTVNVPLNNALDAAGSTDPSATRSAFEAKWNRWNTFRLVASLAAFACLAWGLVEHGRALS